MNTRRDGRPTQRGRKLKWQLVVEEWECPHGVDVKVLCPTCLPNMVLAFADAEWDIAVVTGLEPQGGA